MATLRIAVPSSSLFPQQFRAGYLGDLIDSLIGTVEKVEQNPTPINGKLRVSAPLTVEEVLDRVDRMVS